MTNQKLKPYLVYALIITLVVLPVFSASLALSYVSDDLDFVPMREEYAAPGRGYSGKTYVIPSINYKMVYIPPGTFMMGSPSSEKGDDDEKQHRVTLTKGFLIGATEVTQGQWKKIMGNNPSHFERCGDDCPVEMVSWNECQEFIRKLNKRERTDNLNVARNLVNS